MGRLKYKGGVLVTGLRRGDRVMVLSFRSIRTPYEIYVKESWADAVVIKQHGPQPWEVTIVERLGENFSTEAAVKNCYLFKVGALGKAPK